MMTLTQDMPMHDRCPAWGYGIHDLGPGCWCGPTVEFEDVETQVDLITGTERVMKVTHHPPIEHSGLRAHDWIDTMVDQIPKHAEA